VSSVDELAKRGGEEFYRWFNKARVVLMFGLGCALIIYSVIDSEANIAYIVVGAVLIGLVPVDQWLQRLPHPPQGDNNNGGERQTPTRSTRSNRPR
jgi:hypothetical protein